MFLTTHAAAGIAIGHYVHDPLAVFGIAFASHFVMDFIPHGDEELYHDEEWQVQKRYRRVAFINFVDISFLIGLSLWVIGGAGQANDNRLAIGILGSVLPDFLSYLFPVIHERFSWLFLVRWVYAITKPTGLRYVVRFQDYLHQILHHKIIRSDIPAAAGIAMQVGIIAVLLVLVR